MLSAAPTRLDTALLLLVVVLGSVLAWRETGDEKPVATIATPGSGPHSVPSQAPPARDIVLPNRSEFQEIAARPPFRPSRRPPEPAARAVPVSAPPRPVAPPTPLPPALTLLGTLTGPNGTVAILRSPAAPRAEAASTGDVIAGWTIIDVSSQRVQLTAGAATQELRFPANAAADAIRRSTSSATPSIPSATARAR